MLSFFKKKTGTPKARKKQSPSSPRSPVSGPGSHSSGVKSFKTADRVDIFGGEFVGQSGDVEFFDKANGIVHIRMDAGGSIEVQSKHVRKAAAVLTYYKATRDVILRDDKDKKIGTIQAGTHVHVTDINRRRRRSVVSEETHRLTIVYPVEGFANLKDFKGNFLFERITDASEEKSVDPEEVIKSIPLFMNLTDEQRKALTLGLVERRISQDGLLIEEGTEGKEFYILAAGRAEVSSEDAGKVAELIAGDYCGEQALLAGHTGVRRNASIRAMEETVVLVADQTLFNRVLKDKTVFVKRDAKRKAIMSVTKSTARRRNTGNAAKDASTIRWLLEAVKDNMLFEPLDLEERQEVISEMFFERIPKGKDLIIQGDDKGETFYVIYNGQFQILVNGYGVDIFKRGQCFGELALVRDTPRAATVRALTECEVWTLTRDQFRTAVRETVLKQDGENLKVLQGIDVFQPLLQKEMKQIVMALEEKHYAAGTTIIKQGELGTLFYIVKTGKAQVTKRGKDGTLLDEELTSRYFGERAIIKSTKRAATITAKTDMALLELSQKAFTRLLGPLADIMQERIKGYKDPEKPKRSRPEEAKNERPGTLQSPLDVCDLKDFKTLGVLGKGAYGYVTLVEDPNNGRTYALKAIRKSDIVKHKQQHHVVNEKNLMMQLTTPFIVRLWAVYRDVYQIYFLLEPCLGGEMFMTLRKRRHFDEPTTRFYAACVIEAFAHMHAKNIIYRDLKPENLVFDEKGYAKITDFGFAKEVIDKTFTVCGTPDYLAPEILTQKGHGKGVDWWTLGVLVYECLRGMPPFYASVDTNIYKKIIHNKYDIPKTFTREAQDLVRNLLQRKPTKRLGVIKGGPELIRQHSFFRRAHFDWRKFQAQQIRAPIRPKVLGLKNFHTRNIKKPTKMEKVKWEPYEDHF